LTKQNSIQKLSIKETSFIVVDVETTGLNAIRDRITEIGMVHVRNGRIFDKFETLVNPGVFIPRYITEMTGITNDMVYNKPSFKESFPGIKKFLSEYDGNIVFVGHNASFDYKFISASIERTMKEKFELPVLCTCRLARRLNKSLRSKSLYSLSQYYRIKIRNRHRALDDAKATAKILMYFLDELENAYGIEFLNDLLSFQYKKIYETSGMPGNIKKIKVTLKNIPDRPGVYFMRSKNDELLYVGKAKNLHDRVNSYFYHNTSHTPKIRKMIRQVNKVEYETTGSELSALILESRLIKKHKPKFNTATKRYGRFPFIKLDVQNSYPVAAKTFEVKLDGARYYGPFKSSYTVESLLERIDKSFFLRKCDYKKLKPSKAMSTCMYYEFKQCKGPCNFTQSLNDYRKEVEGVMRFLESEASPGALKQLEDKMYLLADEMKYEEASSFRDRITDLKRVILNMELTTSNINLKNFIVKCRETNVEGLNELFFVAGGKLLKTMVYPGKEIVYEPDYVKELINNIYFNGNLFNSTLYNNYGKFEKDELDGMKIISNWIFNNNSPKTLMKINDNSSTDKILKFVCE
jgi:DNA polymerase-3 subunit epsilon